MSEKEFFLKRWLDAFLGIFESAAKKLWNDLSPEQQEAMKNGSGVLKVINDNITKSAEEVKAAIVQAFPNIPLDTIVELANHFNLNVGDKVEDAIAAIQKWLVSKEGTAWDNAMNIAAQTLSFFLSGKEARPGIIASLMEKVYRWFIK